VLGYQFPAPNLFFVKEAYLLVLVLVLLITYSALKIRQETLRISGEKAKIYRSRNFIN